MSEEEKPFAVRDRRHFTQEGEVREDDRHDGAPGAVASRSSESRGETPSLDFTGLLLSLGAQATLLLEHDSSEGNPPDVLGARAIISLLEVLQEKTEGRRTPEEDQVLSGILYELRMAYLASSRTSGA